MANSNGGIVGVDNPPILQPEVITTFNSSGTLTTASYTSEIEYLVIAGAGGAAHLPGMTASQTKIPVLGVPIRSKQLDGLDSLLSIAQMPKGVPVGTLAIGEAGAVNAALLAISILGLNDKTISAKYEKWRLKQTQSVLLKP